jgi:hypothetical protein
VAHAPREHLRAHLQHGRVLRNQVIPRARSTAPPAVLSYLHPRQRTS